MSRYKQLSNTNDYHIGQKLKRIYGVNPNKYKSLQEVLEALDAHLDLTLPFTFSELIPVYQTFPVMSEVMFPKNNSLLVNLLSEVPEGVFMLTDSMIQGPGSLFVASVLPPVSVYIDDWISGQQRPKLMMNTINDDETIIAAPLHCYSIN